MLRVSFFLTSLNMFILVACGGTTTQDASAANTDAATIQDAQHIDSANEASVESDAAAWDTMRADMTESCEGNDPNEPDDTAAQATDLNAPGRFDVLVLCDQVDWYRFVIPGGNGLSIDARFLHTEANIDLYLQTADFIPVAVSQSDDDNERITFDLFEQQQELLLEVRSIGPAAVPDAQYSLEILFHPGGYSG